MLVDENIYTGSLNIAQRYTSKKYGSRAFRDLSILLKNKEAKYKTKDFILNWILDNKQYIPDFNEEETKYVFKQIDQIYESKDKENTNKTETTEWLVEEPPKVLEISQSMVDLVVNSKEKVRIIQPYIQNIVEFEDALEDALNRGVEVEIITARKRDQPIYSSLLNSDLFERLLNAGAKVYEEPYKFLHMKALSVDGKYLSIGSFNQDNTSFYCNNEANLLITNNSNEMNKNACLPTFEHIFQKLKQEWRVVPIDEQYTTIGMMKAFFWKRMLDIHYFVMRNR